MAPDGMTGLCVEVTLPPGSPYQFDSDELKARVYADLVDVGLLTSEAQVVGCHQEHVTSAYPIYKQGFRSHADAAKSALASYTNLDLAGRMALFEHDNIDEAVGFALELPLELQPA